jgi:hypothetical protein
MMKGTGVFRLPSAASSSGKGRRSRKRRRRSSSADSSSVAASSFCPMALRFIQRRRLATASRARTGSPSWKREPSRSVTVQSRPSSSSSTAPSAICGRGAEPASVPYSVS